MPNKVLENESQRHNDITVQDKRQKSQEKIK